jgi:hypothetical protein
MLPLELIDDEDAAAEEVKPTDAAAVSGPQLCGCPACGYREKQAGEEENNKSLPSSSASKGGRKHRPQLSFDTQGK